MNKEETLKLYKIKYIDNNTAKIKYKKDYIYKRFNYWYPYDDISLLPTKKTFVLDTEKNINGYLHKYYITPFTKETLLPIYIVRVNKDISEDKDTHEIKDWKCDFNKSMNDHGFINTYIYDIILGFEIDNNTIENEEKILKGHWSVYINTYQSRDQNSILLKNINVTNIDDTINDLIINWNSDDIKKILIVLNEKEIKKIQEAHEYNSLLFKKLTIQ